MQKSKETQYVRRPLPIYPVQNKKAGIAHDG
jgi:hypothetical protein